MFYSNSETCKEHAKQSEVCLNDTVLSVNNGNMIPHGGSVAYW